MAKLIKLLMAVIILYGSLSAGSAYSAEYYVNADHPQANDSNSGTEMSPWLTIQKAGRTMVAGDTVFVKAGTYDERVTPSNSGSSGNYINYVAYPGEKVVMRGFDLSSKNYIKIIGFEITHTNTTYSRAIVMSGTCSYIEILNNYIHHTYGDGGAVRAYGASTSYITVRGNEFYYINCFTPGVTCGGNGWAIQASSTANETHHWLVEYNIAHRLGDFINLPGGYNIVRNNNLYDYQDAYFTGGGGHVDFFQPCGGACGDMINNIYESNFMGDNIELNSHVLQMRETSGDGAGKIIFRGNVSYNVGSYALQAGSIDYVRHYNNTFYRMCTRTEGTGTVFIYNPESGDDSIGNHNFNNIIAEVNTSHNIIWATTESSVTASNNLCYNSRSHASCVSTSNPLFGDPGNGDFRIQSGSPAINAGKAITTVSSVAGSGTSFNVVDAGFFTAGFGIAGGDKIKVGSNNPVTITSISSNTITVDSSIAWNTGDGVYWRDQDTRPDIGAYEYKPGGYSYDVAIGSPLPGSVVSGSVSIQASVVNADNVRTVIFYVDGVPKATVYRSPYTFIWNTSGLPARTYRIEARSYALYADSTVSRSARMDLRVVSVDSPSAPRGLRIVP